VVEVVRWDAGSGVWGGSTQFSAKTAPNFLGSSGALAAISQSGTDETSRLYYLGTDKQIYEYKADEVGNWTTSPDQSNEWALNDETQGRIAAIGWDDQVRVYYQSNGEVVESSLSGDVWFAASGV